MHSTYFDLNRKSGHLFKLMLDPDIIYRVRTGLITMDLGLNPPSFCAPSGPH